MLKYSILFDCIITSKLKNNNSTIILTFEDFILTIYYMIPFIITKFCIWCPHPFPFRFHITVYPLSHYRADLDSHLLGRCTVKHTAKQQMHLKSLSIASAAIFYKTIFLGSMDIFIISMLSFFFHRNSFNMHCQISDLHFT